MNELTKNAVELVQSPRTAATVSAATTATGLGTYFSLFPWGAIASCIGAILSTVMIFIQIYKFILYRKRATLEIKRMEREEADRIAAGGPLRRAGDLD